MQVNAVNSLVWHATIVRFLVGMVIGLLRVPDGELWALPTASEIAAEIKQQDRAWDDLEIRYQVDTQYLTNDQRWEDQPQLRMNWILTQSGWQRVRRERDTSSKRVWVEEASFNGDYYMSRDSQSAGSGAFGHQIERFLYHSNVPHMFGLAVSGVELSMPVSIADFLTSEESEVALEDSADGGLIIARGNDLMAKGVKLELHLDPAVGFRPRKTVISDANRLLSIYADLKYQKCQGKSREFWFPVHGVWKGFRPGQENEVSRVTYRAQDVRVNVSPSRDRFVLTYPSGSLLLNTDTGDSFYLNSDTTTADVPFFAGKKITLAEHDLDRENEMRSETLQNVPSRRSFLFLVINLIVLVTVVFILGIWKWRKQP